MCGTMARAKPRPAPASRPTTGNRTLATPPGSGTPKTRQYYYHKFYIQQPDLNWRNPKVHQAFKDIIAFWLQRGVGGFRFDAITSLYEDPADARRRRGERQERQSRTSTPTATRSLTTRVPTTSPACTRLWPRCARKPDKFDFKAFPGTRVLIGETYLPNVTELAKMYGTPQKPEFHLPMDTQVGMINMLDVTRFRARLNDAETRLDGNVPLLLFDNHDNPRIDARYGDGVHNDQIERVIATVLFASRGAALMYYGDEIGMVTTPPTRKEDVKDPIGITGWPKEKGRDGERTPMQWSSEPNAGFTAGTPWLPVPPSADRQECRSGTRQSRFTLQLVSLAHPVEEDSARI